MKGQFLDSYMALDPSIAGIASLLLSFAAEGP